MMCSLYKSDFGFDKEKTERERWGKKNNLMIRGLAKALDSLGCHGDHHSHYFTCR